MGDRLPFDSLRSNTWRLHLDPSVLPILLLLHPYLVMHFWELKTKGHPQLFWGALERQMGRASLDLKFQITGKS